jgi:hypothetical protein
MYRNITIQREELKKDNKLLSLLESYRAGKPLTQHNKELIFVGLSDFCYHLAKKHYGEPQATHSRGETTIEHQTRIDTVLDFILESSLDIPIKGVIYSIHRRYAWIELLVEFKVAGVAYLEGVTTTKKVNSSITKDIINGIKIERQLTERNNGRIPLERDVTLEYVHQLLDKGKTISYASIERFTQRYSAYKGAKNKTGKISFNESYFITSEDSDSIRESE